MNDWGIAEFHILPQIKCSFTIKQHCVRCSLSMLIMITAITVNRY